MENQIFAEPNPTPQRPAFLTTLCILSFVMTGLCAIFVLFTLITQLFLPHPVSDFRRDSMPILNSVVIFLSNFISLAGVILMWKMKKSGYLIYVFAETIPWITSVIALKATVHESVNPLATSLGTIFMIIFDVIFIFLYSKNLRYMK